MPSSAGAVILGQGSILSLPWQLQAWRFYSLPDGSGGNASGMRLNQGAVGEVRFIMGWIAQQIGRVGWHVDIDGVRLEDEAAKEMMAQVSNEDSTTIIATNLIVAGELNYIALPPGQISSILGSLWDATVGDTLPGDDDKKWITVSVIDRFRQQLFGAANSGGLNLRGIWPHPAYPIAPDPPLRGVLDVLAEIEQLSDLAYSQNRSRIANMGILTIANDLDLLNSLPNGSGTVTTQNVEDVINAPIMDPRRTSAAPIIFAAPMEYFTGALANGARAVQWTRPDLEEYTSTLESRMRFAIQRLAWGFPVAPEILLGMTATNRAVAFQIEESTYRAYIEPICDLVGKVYARALHAILEGNPRVQVLPDATVLLARRHSIADAKDLYDRGIVGAPYVREVAGVDEDDAATDEDLHRIVFLRKGTNEEHAREADPSEVSGNEPVRASGAFALGALGHSLEGAVEMAYTQFLQRVGAAARTRLQRQGAPAMELDPEVIPTKRLPSFLGPDRLEELGVDLEQCAAPVVQFLAEWWTSAAAYFHDDAPFPGPVEHATLQLTTHFKEWCKVSATIWPPTTPPNLVPGVLGILDRHLHPVPAISTSTEGAA
jgi:hypothetical protein